jgi:glycosyltransferase involved in cell wall biosynthesis
MISYNQRDFLDQALESLLNQKCKYKYEIIIRDDGSTDGSDILIANYSQKYKSVTKLVGTHRLGIAENFRQVYSAAQGKYFCILEGDDFLVDMGKLERQCSYLEENPTCSFCWDKGIRLNTFDTSQTQKTYYPDWNNSTELSSSIVLSNNYVLTASAMYRKHWSKLPEWLYSLQAIDWPLQILHALQGEKVKFFAETSNIYRYHSRGTWPHVSEVDRLMCGLELRLNLLAFCGVVLSESQTSYIQSTINPSLSLLGKKLSSECLPKQNLSNLEISQIQVQKYIIKQKPLNAREYIKMSSLYYSQGKYEACSKSIIRAIQCTQHRQTDKLK